MLFPAGLFPWTAVSLIAVYQVETPYLIIGWISIALTGMLGLYLSIRAIYKQEQ